MSCLKQTSSGDLDLVLKNAGKTLTIVRNKSEAAAQKLTNRFLLWEGEWFLDTRQGFPFRQVFGVKSPDVRAIKQMLTKLVLSVPPIVSIERLQLSVDTRRQASLDLRATTDEGRTIVGGLGSQFILLP